MRGLRARASIIVFVIVVSALGGLSPARAGTAITPASDLSTPCLLYTSDAADE